MIFNTKITPLNICISIILFVLLCILIKNIFSVREGATSSVDCANNQVDWIAKKVASGEMTREQGESESVQSCNIPSNLETWYNSKVTQYKKELSTQSVDDSSSIPTFEVTTDMSATGSYASSGWGGVYTEREGQERHGRPSWSNGTAVIWYETIANNDWGAKNLIRGDGWIMYPIVAQHHRLGIADTRSDSIMPPLNQEWISRGGSVVNQGTTFKILCA